MSYLITGATGAIGSNIVRQLVSLRADIRTLSRNPQKASFPHDVEIFAGDLTAHEFQPGLFDGVKGLFLFPAEGDVRSFLNHAKVGGVKHVVVLSSLAAALEFPRDVNSISSRHHQSVEKAAKESGLDFTILRPGTFANNLRSWAYTIKTQKMVFGPYPDSAQALIHEADIANVAVTALTTTGHRGATYPLTGPQALTQTEQLQTIGTAIGQELCYQRITPDQFKPSMGQFMSAEIIQMLLDYWSDTVEKPDVVRNTVEQVTGKPARTLAQWAAEHVADFQ